MVGGNLKVRADVAISAAQEQALQIYYIKCYTDKKTGSSLCIMRAEKGESV